MIVLATLKAQFEDLRTAVHHSEIEENLTKFKALYDEFIKITAYDDAIKCFTQ
ncbi:hypothetical protein [Kurthia massiliensis]|uniref:hypothetical protein n=1 Tax=Kurthia massiliensis TaxID=1033739 RepID=UPI000301620A|nr:hypothetical protein [Kurthia massiliensis]